MHSIEKNLYTPIKVLQGKEHLYQEDPPEEINSYWLNK